MNQFHGIFFWGYFPFSDNNIIFMENSQKKIRETNLFDFTIFFGLDFLKFSCPLADSDKNSLFHRFFKKFRLIIFHHTFKLTVSVLAGSITLRTASTAMGDNSELCWETTLEFKLVLADCKSFSRSDKSTGIAMLVRISTDFLAAFWNASEIEVGWIPFFKSLSEASSKLPQRTTTLVVPSPASMSWA